MKYRIIGDAMQTVAIELSEGDSVFGRLGSMLFVRGAVRSETAPSGPYWIGLTGTIVKPGEPPLVAYRCESGSGLVGFLAPCAGRIHFIQLDGATRITVSRNRLLAAAEGIQIDPVHLDGEDRGEFISGVFVTLAGSGWAFLHAPGNLVEFNLSKDERMVVDGRMVVMLDGEIDYSPKPVASPGFSTGSGIFMMHLTGPGRVVLNTQL